MVKKTQPTSKAYQLRLSENALRNIDEITGYIAFTNHQTINAIKVGDAIFNLLEKIERNPYAFRECTDIPTKTKMYRQAVCMSWHIIYKVVPDQIIVLGLIHTSRKPSKTIALRMVK